MKRPAYIFDIDETLAVSAHRVQKYLSCHDAKNHETADWDSFYADSLHDAPIKDTVQILKTLSRVARIIFVTSRSEVSREITNIWLERHTTIDPHNQLLFMRKDGDERPDDIIKKEIYLRGIEPFFDVRGVFEDRDRVVRMWRSLGLTCYQVTYGDY